MTGTHGGNFRGNSGAHFDEIEHSVKVAMTQLALKSELAQCTPRPELDGKQVLLAKCISTTGATTGDRR